MRACVRHLPGRAGVLVTACLCTAVAVGCLRVCCLRLCWRLWCNVVAGRMLCTYISKAQQRAYYDVMVGNSPRWGSVHPLPHARQPDSDGMGPMHDGVHSHAAAAAAAAAVFAPARASRFRMPVHAASLRAAANRVGKGTHPYGCARLCAACNHQPHPCQRLCPGCDRMQGWHRLCERRGYEGEGNLQPERGDVSCRC